MLAFRLARSGNFLHFKTFCLHFAFASTFEHFYFLFAANKMLWWISIFSKYHLKCHPEGKTKPLTPLSYECQWIRTKLVLCKQVSWKEVLRSWNCFLVVVMSGKIENILESILVWCQMVAIPCNFLPYSTPFPHQLLRLMSHSDHLHHPLCFVNLLSFLDISQGPYQSWCQTAKTQKPF